MKYVEKDTSIIEPTTNRRRYQRLRYAYWTYWLMPLAFVPGVLLGAYAPAMEEYAKTLNGLIVLVWLLVSWFYLGTLGTLYFFAKNRSAPTMIIVTLFCGPLLGMLYSYHDIKKVAKEKGWLVENK